MQDLLKPDFGVMLLTICNFLLLVYLLKKFAWKSIIGALEKREQQIAADKQHAQQARVEAEKLKNELSAALNRVAEEASAKIAQAVKTGETQREQLLAAAKEQSARLLEQARAEISTLTPPVISVALAVLVALSMKRNWQTFSWTCSGRARETSIWSRHSCTCRTF